MTTLENIGWLAVEIMKAKRATPLFSEGHWLGSAEERQSLSNRRRMLRRRRALQARMRKLIDAELADRDAVRQK